MNILFLTMSPQLLKVEASGIYNDLMRKFVAEGHNVYVMAPLERRNKQKTTMCKQCGVNVLEVWTLNVTRANLIEKGIGQVLLESQFKAALKKYLRDVKFDIILYSTPPITFSKVIAYAKRLNPQAISYLMLKDIFPQNAVDIGMFGKNSLFYKYFRKKEVALYKQSDYIGCMSPANVEFVLKHNPEIKNERVEVAPNSVELTQRSDISQDEKYVLREKYGLPTDKPVFIYGGNLGRPQGIGFLVKCLDANKTRTDCHFVVVGSGTERHLIQEWYDAEKPNNMTLLQFLPKEDYDALVQTCEVGLIFLDHRFTIPNFPSRMLSYLEYKMPVVCATDPNTDMGRIAEQNGFGYWCESNSVGAFTNCVDKMLHSDIKAMGEKGYKFLCDNYLVDNTYDTIMKHFKQ